MHLPWIKLSFLLPGLNISETDNYGFILKLKQNTTLNLTQIQLIFTMNNAILIISSIRLIPHIIFLLFFYKADEFDADIKRWTEILLKTENKKFYYQFLMLMTFYPEFRNLFYYRIGRASIILNIFCPRINTLFLASSSIGPGLFIQHGFSTIIAAKHIGKNCWINQQVTIGYSNETDCPTIGDNVTVCAGAKIIGGVTIGENSKIGANAVVVKNVPPNVTVVGIPAQIVRRNGIRGDELL